MRAALIREYGTLEVGDRDEPRRGPGQALVELRAAPLNPVDTTIGRGTFYGGSPPLPFVPGVEAVGVVAESDSLAPGTRVYANRGGLGLTIDGTWSERFVAPDEALIDLPEGVDDALAAALGVAGLAGFLPLAWAAPVRPGDCVLVLGATGAVGSVAIQAAKVLGARRVLAAGRDPERLERARALGADEVVRIDDGFAERLAAVAKDEPPTLVVDGLWGEPAVAAMQAAARGARFVQLGQSAGATAVVPSAAVRGKQLHVLGFSNYAVPQEDFVRGYRDLVGHAAAGRVTLDLERVPLERAPEAWRRQVEGDGTKLVLVP